MDLIQKAKALCLSACLEAVIAIICICAYAIAVDVLQISQYSTLTRICCIIGMVSVMSGIPLCDGLCYGVGMGFFSSI